MAEHLDPAKLVYNWWERFLNTQSEAFGGDRELTELSNKLSECKSQIFADSEVTPAELETLLERMEAIAALYARLAARKGVAVPAAAPTNKQTMRVFVEDAEIHFQTLAGGAAEYFRGGLLREFAEAEDPSLAARRIALDILTSASTAIAIDKIHLVRAQLSALSDEAQKRTRLTLLQMLLREELEKPVWAGARLGIAREELESACRFSSVVAAGMVPLPSSIRGDNRMIANRPQAGRDAANLAVVRTLFTGLRRSSALFLDRIDPGERVNQVAIKLDLNLGIEGPPSVSDPAVTYAVIRELLRLGLARGVTLRFSLGDSNGIENAPVGRTSLDVMRDTGNYHEALKAALEHASEIGDGPEVQTGLEWLRSLEQASRPAYLGAVDDRRSTPDQIAAIEKAAAPWVLCVDYDVAGYRAIEPDLGPLGRAVRGASPFHVAAPWVDADYRVHISRSASTHLFAGWTGALKGLIGLHGLGGRPGDMGMKIRGENPLDVLTAVMHSGAFTGLFASRAGIPDFSRLLSECQDSDCLSACRRSEESWNNLTRLAAGRRIWAEGATALEKELRRDQSGGAPDIEIMAKMRREATALLLRAEAASPGFREAMLQGVADGTRAFLLTLWNMREALPREMRDESMGQRIGLLSRLPHQADLVVQGAAKVGIGGGPDAYTTVKDVGIVVAGTDEISVDLAVLRAAGIPGCPWEYNHPIRGALQFGRGPMSWEEIHHASLAAHA